LNDSLDGEAVVPISSKNFFLLVVNQTPESSVPETPKSRTAAESLRILIFATVKCSIRKQSTMKQRHLNCMEIQGGSGSTSNYFSQPGLDIWVSSSSATSSKAGGSDLYLLSSCASGRITRMLLADICCHGLGFGQIASDLRELIKKNINSVKQARLVRQIDQQLDSESQRGCFATMILSTYFAPTRTLSLCNVGHASPLLFRAKSRQWTMLKHTPTELSANETPDGVVGCDEYQQFDTQCDVGDLVLSYSSTLSECRDQHGHTIGCEGVLSRVLRIESSRPAQLAASLADAIRKEYSGNLSGEDGTIMLCQTTSNKVPWLDNILAPIRYLRGVSDKTRLDDAP
jgi:sigma-B regulation protein RsbU (phosphoserine phosphatase)